MTCCVLASGSSGNALWLASGETRILMDAGLSAREIGRRLSGIGESIEALQAVCLTHEHADHCRGLAQLQRRYGVALYANAPTAAAVDAFAKSGRLSWCRFRTGEAFWIGAIRVDPFPIPHDASEPVGFVFSDAAGARMAVATDLGTVPPSLYRRLLDCDVLMLEFNHDAVLLRNSARPRRLQLRIAGPQGHLSNAAAAEFLSAASVELPRCLLLAHLSAECNRPGLALRAATLALENAAPASRPVLYLTKADAPGERIVFGPDAAR